MATTLSTKWLTLIDVASRLDPNGKMADVAEIIAKPCPILDDMPWKEGNRPDGTVHTARAGYGTAAWRRINQGTVPVKSTTTQFSDVVGLLNAWTEVDEKAAQMSGDVVKFRADEERAQMQSMHEELAGTLFYGNAGTTPEEFTGIAPRYAAYGSNARTSHVFNAGASGSDTTSIYLVGWGPDTVFGLYPKGSVAGLNRKDLGLIRIEDSDGRPLMAYSSHYTWDCGLGVRDWRAIVRISNIDYSDLETAGDSDDSSANLIKLMLRAMHLLPQGVNMKPVFYAHPDVVGLLAVKVMEKAKTLTIGDVTGVNGLTRPGVLQLLGVPVHGCESIVLTETALTA